LEAQSHWAPVGFRSLGPVGIIVGGAFGAIGATLIFYRLLLPWRARHLLPIVLQQQDPGMFDELVRTDDAIRRMAAYEDRES
jgi:hypothetical protein